MWKTFKMFYFTTVTLKETDLLKEQGFSTTNEEFFYFCKTIHIVYAGQAQYKTKLNDWLS